MTYDEIVRKLNYDTRSSLADKPITTKKEHLPMDFANAKVVVGNRIYPSKFVNFESSPGEYPIIEATAILDPRKAIPYASNTNTLHITNVIFNPPATIVFWSDNTKTVVKARNEFYDPEKGIAMAISKKMIGDNKYEYYYLFEHWLKKWNKQSKDEKLRNYLEKAMDDAFEKYHDERFDEIHKGVPAND